MVRAQISVEWLKSEREKRRWTQNYVAEQLDVDRATVQRWEYGTSKPSPRLYRQLCLLFGRDPNVPEREQALCVVPDDDDEEVNVYALFVAQDLTARLLRAVSAWPSPNGNARYHALQDRVAYEVEYKDNTMKHEKPITRRNALRRLASLPIEAYGLSLTVPTFPKAYPFEMVLTQCAAGIAACWYLRRGKDLAFADYVISRYTPTLKEITERGPSMYRKDAADLLAQSLLLKGSVTCYVNGNHGASLRYRQQAEHYSQLAENTSLAIMSVRQQASACDYADDWRRAQSLALKAVHMMDETQSPISLHVQCDVYAGLANYQGHCRQKQDALRSLGKAQATLAQSANESAPIWLNGIDLEAGVLLNGGLAYYHLDMQDEAIASFTDVAALPSAAETQRVESFTDQAMAELNREGMSRDMEFCIDCWQHGARRAIDMQSEQAYKESKIAYTAMRAAWPGEPRIKALRDEMVHW